MSRKQQDADFEGIDEIVELVRRRQPDPFKTLEAEYDVGLGYLRARIGSGEPRELDVQEVELAELLAQHYLSNYFFGYLALKFSAPYQRRSVTLRQEVIEKAIGYLAGIECARLIMGEWFEAALTGKLHRIVRRWLGSGFTLSPWAWLSRSLGKLILSDPLEKLSWFKTDGYRAPKFGLSGYHIMFTKTNRATAAEFASLMAYLKQLMSKREDLLGIPDMDAVEVLTQAQLTAEQRHEFLSVAISWLDVQCFPNHDWREDIKDPVERARLSIERLELGKGLTWLLSLPLKSQRLQARIRRDYEVRMERGLPHWQRVPLEQEARQRRQFVAAMIGKLAFRSERSLEVIEQAGRADLETAGVSSQELIESAQKDAMRCAVGQLPVMGLVANTIKQQGVWWGLPNETKDALDNSEVELTGDVLEYLVAQVADDERLENSLRWLEENYGRDWIGLSARKRPTRLTDENLLQGKTEAWVWDILEKVPKVSYAAIQRWARTWEHEERPAVLRAAMTLHQNLVKRPGTAVGEMEVPLANRLEGLLIDGEMPVDPAWVHWILMLADSGERLMRILEAIRERLEVGDETLRKRDRLVLEAIAEQVEALEEPDAAVAAASWLATPEDWLERDECLRRRLDEAIYLLRAPRGEMEGQQRIVAVLEWVAEKTIRDSHVLAEKKRFSWGEGFSWWKNAIEQESSLVTVAKALKTVRFAELAVPLLDRLLSIEPKPFSSCGWDLDYNAQRRTIHAEALKSLAALNPLTAESIHCLVKHIFVTRTSDTLLDDAAGLAFVENDLMPSLIHDVDERAVNSLVAMIWHAGTGPWLDDQGRFPELGEERFVANELSQHWLDANESELLCVLQALANVTSLSGPQQDCVWTVYKTARGELKKFLCLLVLGRQRPVSERTMRELLRLPRQSPLISSVRRLANVGGLSDNDDIVVRQSLALQLLDNMLRSASDDPIVRQYENEARRVITRAASFQRAVIERSLEGRPSYQGLQAPLSVIRGKHDGADHEIWEPSDTAYDLLWRQNVSEMLFR